MTHDFYIRRCFQLAKLGGKEVQSNPQVGAVLVYQDRIIGEGYHKNYGGPHAEVHAVESVKETDRSLIKDATLYVSLEPCCIDSKTPACSDLIIRNQIKKVIVSCTDPNPKMSGQSLKLLKEKGVEVISGILEKEGIQLIAPFKSQLNGLPYITLKWAKSKDHFMGKKDESIWLSNAASKVYAHKLRSQNDGILVGTNTAILDNPALTTREYPGDSPTRIVIDRNLKTPRTYHIWDGAVPTLFICSKKEAPQTNIDFIELDFDSDVFLSQVLSHLFKHGIYRLLIEGGQATLRQLIKQNLWNEAHIIQTNKTLTEGLKSPLIHGDLVENLSLNEDQIFKIVNNVG